jgi:hypothetical protein
MDEMVVRFVFNNLVANCMRQRKTYSKGATPDFCLNRKAKVERETPAILARFSTDQERAGSA